MITRTLIVPDSVRDTAAMLCAALAGPAGENMFVRGLYYPVQYVAPPENPDEEWEPPAKPEPSYYMSTGSIAEEFADALPCTYINEQGELVTRPADYEALMTMVQAAGIEVTQAELEVILSQCDVSAQGWREAAARLGLSVNPVYEDVA